MGKEEKMEEEGQKRVYTNIVAKKVEGSKHEIVNNGQEKETILSMLSLNINGIKLH